MFSRWASHDFSTDWGTRDVSEHDVVYDPISYHQGSVWPLFTGWASLAEYRTGRDLAGYQHLMQNTNLTTEQGLGAVTELLSGALYDPFGRSTSHQMWSSAMVLAPAMRGLFGVSVDAIQGIITVDPHLPAQWPSATLRHLQVGGVSVDLTYTRQDSAMLVSLLADKSAKTDSRIRLASNLDGARIGGDGQSVRIPLPAIEVGLMQGADNALPLPGALTEKLKVLSEDRGPRSLTLQLEAQGGSTQDLLVRQNNKKIRLQVDGASLGPNGNSLVVAFPTGAGYQRQTVVLRW